MPGAPPPGEPNRADRADAFLTALDPLRPAALLALDFDGTLAPIVDDPAAARPIPGALDLLGRATVRWGEVAVVSGRPLEFLRSQLPVPGLTLVGLYGLEVLRAGRRHDQPDAAAWRTEVARAVQLAGEALPAAVVVEPKGVSLTLHFRTCPEHADAVAAVAGRIAAATGLSARDAKMSVELHPPVPVDKGTALADLAAGGAGPVCFIGDDLGDLPAFDLLDALRAHGRPTLGVTVAGPETPAALTDRADVVLDGPAGVLDLVERLSR